MHVIECAVQIGESRCAEELQRFVWSACVNKLSVIIQYTGNNRLNQAVNAFVNHFISHRVILRERTSGENGRQMVISVD